MQIFHRLRRLAAALLLVPLTVLQPVAAAERTESANVVQVFAFAAPVPTDFVDVPKSVRSDMVLARDGNIYFASSAGGKGFGAVGRLAPDGTVSTVYAFVDATEGLSAFGSLVQGEPGDDSLYGTTYFGGENSTGTIFKISLPDGAFTRLYQFDKSSNKNPAFPYTGLVVASDHNLYGTTRLGGSDNKGTVYRISTSGTFSVVHSFNGSDGSDPQGRLVVGGDGELYGTTLLGGSQDRGVIYRVSTTGEFDRLYSFPSLSAFDETGIAINASGANPRAGLLATADGKFYGTAYQGGVHGNGTLFRITVNGDSADLEVVHAFAGWPFDAGFPLSVPVQGPDGSFYGTSEKGGYTIAGAAWKVAPDGTSELLHSFSGGAADGSQPYAGLLFANNSLYGVSNSDDVGSAGSIFKLERDAGSGLPVDLTISAKEILVNNTVVITWNAPGAVTCDKFGSWSEPTDETDPKHITPTSGTETLDPSVGVYSYALACTDGAGVVHNGYVGLYVNVPSLDSVDGGEIIGGGELSLLLLALFAALLFRKILKETRSSCP